MTVSISWALNVTVAGGPTLTKTQALDIDAYDKIEVVVPPEAKGMEVQVQPATKDLVQFLAISFDPIAKTAVKLSYSIDQPEDDATKRIKLGYLQVLVGLGAMNALGADKSLNKLYFYRDKDDLKPEEQVTLQILVGRKVAPEAAPAPVPGGTGSPAGGGGTGGAGGSAAGSGGSTGTGAGGGTGTGSTGGAGGTD